jgi:hypothetical protein
MPNGKRQRCILILLLFCALPCLSFGGADRCSLCGNLFTGDTIYTVTDKVTGEVKQICYNCAMCPNVCSICGLPAVNDPLALPDGRFLCARDAKDAVLTDEEGLRICSEMKDALDRLFSRFMTFPDTNVDVTVVDRVNLMELFQVPGNDFACPNVLGYTQFVTNENNEFRYSISLMSALPRAQFKAVCAHEYTHCWARENLTQARLRVLSKSAQEGFCELVAYLLMNSQNEEREKKEILANTYSRGQINLFVEAEQRFGFNEVVEWMEFGTDAALDKNDLNRIRDVQMASPNPRSSTNAPSYTVVVAPRPSFESLVLESISRIQNQPLATINDRSFSVGETGKVHLGTTNILIRCLAIATNSARIQIVGAGEEQVLKLKARD